MLCHRKANPMKFIEPYPFADPDAAARKLGNSVEAVQDGRIFIERVNEVSRQW